MPLVSPKISFSEYFYFANATDPRGGRSTHPLETILFVSIGAVICGADDFVAIAKWGRKKKDSISKFVDTPNGIPSHDRFHAVLASIKPEAFEKCWLDWITSPQEISGGQIVTIDGQTLRRSYAASTLGCVEVMPRRRTSRPFTGTARGYKEPH